MPPGAPGSPRPPGSVQVRAWSLPRPVFQRDNGRVQQPPGIRYGPFAGLLCTQRLRFAIDVGMFKPDLLFEPERRKLNTPVPLALDRAAMTRTMYLNGGYCEVVEAMIAIFDRGLTPLARTSHARPPGIKFPGSDSAKGKWHE